jgi:hypothetical protein
MAAGEDGQPLSRGELALHVPLGPVSWRWQLGELGLEGSEHFPELGFRQRHPVAEQVGPADLDVLHAPGPRSGEREHGAGESRGR